ncbi:MAG: hypothetical protein JWO38_7380 [Gemmataceae bacterium]|nr:hypothetical protein [Gemmataceae bacterium]
MSSLNLDELKRLCGYREPLHCRPRCQHVSFDRHRCREPAEHECNPGSDGHRPRYVCSRCAVYQVTVVGPVVLAGDVETVRVDGKGRIVGIDRRKQL